jgi:cyclopropane-fatty-acyl-phospholipid synthase
MSAARAAVHAVLGRIRSGRIELRESYSGRSASFGPPAADLAASIDVRAPSFYGALARDRSVGLGESYAEATWDSQDLVTLLRIGARELRRLDGVRGRIAPLMRPLHRVASLPLLNTRRGARRNIAAHYDLGNEMFETFLDTEAMMYSSACFAEADESLESAQERKLERICWGLELTPADHLLEIGTGWGGLAVHAAGRYGCRVTTTTISREQRDHARERVRAAGLHNLVTVLETDYRDLTGRFDKLASIEMIEAVGWQYFDVFFRRCSELLAPDGLMFLQAICADDRAYEAEKATQSFSNSVIFPGGCLPSVAVIHRCLASQTDMRPVWLEDISPSYALTLRAWRERFAAAAPRLEALGYDHRFRRLWEFYFSISEAGFREGRIADVQMAMAKPRHTRSVPAAAPARLVEAPS